MSGLAGRLARLEQTLAGPCPGCADRPPLIELVTPASREIPAGDDDTSPCPDCGKPRELITLLLHFDPRPEGERA